MKTLNHIRLKTIAAQGAVNTPKSELIRIAETLENHNPRKARALSAIIARLEKWQR
jgi:hypothetical protein